MGLHFLAERLLEHEVSFSLRCKTPDESDKGLKDAWLLGVLHVEYEKLKKIQDQQQQ